MNITIKTLEEIGQNVSHKQFENTENMLETLGISSELFSNPVNEYVCALFPEDDDDQNDDGDSEEEVQFN